MTITRHPHTSAHKCIRHHVAMVRCEDCMAALKTRNAH